VVLRHLSPDRIDRRIDLIGLYLKGSRTRVHGVSDRHVVPQRRRYLGAAPPR
jgi:hypothetical protein